MLDELECAGTTAFEGAQRGRGRCAAGRAGVDILVAGGKGKGRGRLRSICEPRPAILAIPDEAEAEASAVVLSGRAPKGLEVMRLVHEGEPPGGELRLENIPEDKVDWVELT